MLPVLQQRLEVIVRCAQRGIVPAINPDEFHILTKDMGNSSALWNEIDFMIALLLFFF